MVRDKLIKRYQFKSVFDKMANIILFFIENVISLPTIRLINRNPQALSPSPFGHGENRISPIICIISIVFTIYIQFIGPEICDNGSLFQVTIIYTSLIPFIPQFTSNQSKQFHTKSAHTDLKIKVYDFKEIGSLNKIITKFYNEEMDNNTRYFLLLKVRLGEYGWRTFHHGIITSSSYLDSYIDFINSQLDISIEEYKDEGNYEKIGFHYFPIPKSRWDQFDEGKWIHVARKPSQTIKLEDFHKKYNIPLNMNYSNWGDVTFSSNDVLIIEGKNNFTVNFNKELNINSIITGNIKFTDHILTDPRYFKRVFKYYTYYIDIIDEKIVFTLNKIKTEFLNSTSDNPYHLKQEDLELKKAERLINPKIGTFDIETIVKDGIHKAYLYSFYDGKVAHSFFADNPGDILPCLNMLRGMLKQKYNAYTFYAHNFSSFDINFMLSALSILDQEGYRVSFMKNNDKYINISITNKTKRVSINLRDSLLVLPMSLANLGHQFGVDVLKTIEPVYQGNINSPFNMCDLTHYNKDVEIINEISLWKENVIKYCETDCISLYQILIKFRDLVFNKWDLFIENYPTTPSLSFGIFRRHYLQDNVIPIYKGKVFDFLRESFTGGSTEMYRPHGRDINCYDANSLYPSVMAHNKFPTGKTYEFIGDIELLYQLEPSIWTTDNSYFIADAQVETIKDLYQPYLQVNHLGKEQGFSENRTIAPNGSFNMKINSCEYQNGIVRGDYKITSKQGYLWFSKSIFKDFVNEIYIMRNVYPKTDPMNLICKLILNSLYGRFAMKPIISRTEFIPRYQNIFEFLDKNIAEDWIEVDKDNILITYRNKNEEGVSDIEYSNSIAIASAITAYARVFMSKFKNNSTFSLLYTDTDSIFIDGKLPNNLVGSELGKFKLEASYQEIVFLGPKIYSGITKDNKVITKIKGFKESKNLTFDNIKELLQENSNLKLNHIKWFRNINTIEMKEQPYILSATANKREFIYESGKAIDTKAFKLNNNKKI